MAGRLHSASASGGIKSRRSPFLYFSIVLLFLSLLFYIFTYSSSTFSHDTVYNAPNPIADYSFVSSLRKFLDNSKSIPYSTAPDDTVSGNFTEQQLKIFDDLITITEEKRLYGGENRVYPWSPPLKVYVYDMPSKFTYDLLRLFQNTYQDTTTLTSNGSPVHRLIEQHSVNYWLWADLIAPDSERLLKNVVRVHKQEDADLFYIPFFTTISFFLLEKQQSKALYRVKL